MESGRAVGIWQGGLCQNRKDARRVGKLEEKDSSTFRIVGRAVDGKRLEKAELSWEVCYGCQIWEEAGHCAMTQPEKGGDPQ